MSEEREYLRVPDFDERQNPRRPKRSTWIKAFVRDLEEPGYFTLTLTQRGFLIDFQRLAADLENRVPDDAAYIANRLSSPRHVVAKSLSTCIQLGLISRFALPVKEKENSNLEENNDDSSFPPSSSISNSESTSGSTTNSTTVLKEVPEFPDHCPRCDGEGCRWCRQGNVA